MLRAILVSAVLSILGLGGVLTFATDLLVLSLVHVTDTQGSLVGGISALFWGGLACVFVYPPLCLWLAERWNR